MFQGNNGKILLLKLGLGSARSTLTTTANLGTVLNQYRVRGRGDPRKSECFTRENVPIHSNKFSLTLTVFSSFLASFFHFHCSIASKLEQSGKQST
jgi:hypothetical protein